jgi:uncharacterized protein (TIGR00255 family)
MRSMTGYGHAEWKRGGRSVTVDIRSVNQRFLEVRFNIPREYMPWENELRALVQQHVARGKVDVSVGMGGNNGAQLAVEPNVELARAFVAGWRQLQSELKLPGTIDISLLQSRAELVRTSNAVAIRGKRSRSCTRPSNKHCARSTRTAIARGKR